MNIVKVNVFCSLIIDAIKEMKKFAREGNFIAQQNLNGVEVLVAGNSDEQLVLRDQQRAQRRYIEGPVGPYPKPLLSSSDLANDVKVEKENEERRNTQKKDYAEEKAQKKAKFAKKLKTCPEMDRDESKWQKGLEAQEGDGYGLAVYAYAEYWARLMQKEIDEGKKLSEIAEQTSREADVEGITGFMYGCAIQILSHCWKHGEELRQWHNGEYGQSDCDGVVNPAVLTIG